MQDGPSHGQKMKRRAKGAVGKVTSGTWRKVKKLWTNAPSRVFMPALRCNSRHSSLSLLCSAARVARVCPTDMDRGQVAQGELHSRRTRMPTGRLCAGAARIDPLLRACNLPQARRRPERYNVTHTSLSLNILTPSVSSHHFMITYC